MRTEFQIAGSLQSEPNKFIRKKFILFWDVRCCKKTQVDHMFQTNSDKAKKRYRDGTHRTTSPEQTLAKVKPLLKEMGITRLANLTGLDRIGIPVISAVRPNSRSVSISQGKGATLEAAKASAAMEAIENFHAERIDLPLKLASHRELSIRNKLIDLQGLPKLKGGSWHPDRQILWVKGRNLITDDEVWLPYETVHTNYTVPTMAGSGCFVASTNGLASGNHILEAISHGICEVVERDANTLWNRLPDNARADTRVDLSTIDDDQFLTALNALSQSGFSVGVWDMTSDIGVASFYCLITDDRAPRNHSGGGAGCHLSPAIAVSRAIHEAIQVRLNYIAGARDDLGRSEYTVSEIEAKNSYSRSLMNLPSTDTVDFSSLKDQSTDGFHSDVEKLLERLEAAGIRQVISVDLTRKELGVPVVRIVIPGLEGPDDHEGYLPGPRAQTVDA
jgi:YcaO-like protein with predicted kinase domain